MSSTPDTPSSSPPTTTPSFASLTLFGGLASAWAVFLWTQLLEARSGGSPVCLGGSDCGALWDGAFASAIHGWTALPVAGWGLLWGLLATVLPAVAASRIGARRPALVAAVALVALAGVIGVVVLLLVSAQAGKFCINCSFTYALTLLYAVLALPKGWVFLRRHASRGLALAVAALALAWLVLLIPGLRTPKNLQTSGLAAIAAATDGAGHAAGAGGAEVDQGPMGAPIPSVEDFLASLEPPLLQGIADSLAILAGSPTLGLAPPEHYALGGPTAAVRFSEWTDALCGHCANLHLTFEYLQETLPATSFSLESHHFPLDGNCNSHLPVRAEESVRCLAAKAQICVEPTGHGFEYAGALFRNQGQLDNALVYLLAEPYMSRSRLGACVTSPETADRLAADVDEAWKFRPRGTPLVLVDGRQGTQFGPFLYALALAGGDVAHPAFAVLPAPNPKVVDATLQRDDEEP